MSAKLLAHAIVIEKGTSLPRDLTPASRKPESYFIASLRRNSWSILIFVIPTEWDGDIGFPLNRAMM